MKFYYMTDAACLVIVDIKRFRADSHPQHWDAHDENGTYVGYIHVPNDVDPREAARKALRRIDRQVTQLRRDIKEMHGNLRNKSNAAKVVADKDVTHTPILPSIAEQEAARKEAEDKKRLEDQKREEERRASQPPISGRDLTDYVYGLPNTAFDFFQPLYAETANQQNPPVVSALAAAQAIGIAAHRQRDDNNRQQAQLNRAMRENQALTEIVNQQTAVESADTVVADSGTAMGMRVAGRNGEYAGIVSAAPRPARVTNRPRDEPQQAIEAPSWPTQSPSTTQRVSQWDTEEARQFRPWTNNWATWQPLSPPTLSRAQYVMARGTARDIVNAITELREGLASAFCADQDEEEGC